MGKDVKEELGKRAVPELLRLSDGTAVDSPALWRRRREEIREILEEECYGKLPVSGWETEWEAVQEDGNAFGGKAVMRTIDVRIRANGRYASVAGHAKSKNYRAKYNFLKKNEKRRQFPKDDIPYFLPI